MKKNLYDMNSVFLKINITEFINWFIQVPQKFTVKSIQFPKI